MTTRPSRYEPRQLEADAGRDETTNLGFAYRQRKNGMVEILHRGRIASTLRGRDAAEFIAQVAEQSDADSQHLMARITGNYRRGNERHAANHPRNRR